MTLLDVYFNIIRKQEMPEDDDFFYDYWSLDDKGMFLFMTCRNEPNFFTDTKRVDVSDIEGSIPYIWDNSWLEKPYFIPYKDLGLYLNIEVEIDSPVQYAGCQKYPLVCVRGTCDKQCTGKKYDGYCFRELPCTNKRPDWNIWSCKYPNFYDLLTDIANFIEVCPHTDTLIVMFDFTPHIEAPELDFEYCTGIHVRNNKITILEKNRVKEMYREYNRKYPTEDRKIEDSISETYKNFCFKF